MAKKPRAKLTDDQIKEIEALAFHDATWNDVVIMLGYSATWLRQLSKDQGNSVQLAIKRGKLRAKLRTNKKLIEEVDKGDITAIQYFLKREERREERRQDAEKPPTLIHVGESVNSNSNAPKIVISIPSNGRELPEE